jgi:hypothetical protein
MVGTAEILEELIIIPFPEWQTDDEDRANDVALKLRDAFSRARLEPETGETTFAQSSLHNLDELPSQELREAIAVVAATVDERYERTQKSRRKTSFENIGKAVMELALLYRPIPEPPERRQNNPYVSPRSRDVNLSYQSGAMRYRTGKGR